MGSVRDIELIIHSKNGSNHVKLQDAYAAETGAVGTWQMIGYIAPGTKNSAESYTTNVFDYTNSFTGATGGTTMVNALSDNTEGWRATAKTALNDCPISSYWFIQMSKGGTGATVKFAAKISDDANCKPLTANFGNISHD